MEGWQTIRPGASNSGETRGTGYIFRIMHSLVRIVYTFAQVIASLFTTNITFLRASLPGRITNVESSLRREKTR